MPRAGLGRCPSLWPTSMRMRQWKEGLTATCEEDDCRPIQSYLLPAPDGATRLSLQRSYKSRSIARCLILSGEHPLKSPHHNLRTPAPSPSLLAHWAKGKKPSISLPRGCIPTIATVAKPSSPPHIPAQQPVHPTDPLPPRRPPLINQHRHRADARARRQRAHAQQRQA